jgi:hypothetical protein
MNGSFEQQFQYSTQLSAAVEDAEASSDDFRSAAVVDRHNQLAHAVEEGRRSSGSLLVIPKALIQRAKLTFPIGAFDNGKTSW